jgi:purine-binding chemotaxis protein CheW
MPLSQSSLSILLARIGDIAVGFSADAVHEIVRMVAIAPLPGTPPIIEGAVNLHGRIVPVVDIRQRLALPAVAASPDQYLLFLTTSERLIAVRVDDVEDITDVAESSLESPASLSPVLQRLEGVAAVASGALVIYDVDAFLTQAEDDALDLAVLVPE